MIKKNILIKVSLIILIGFFFTSCAFNSIFLQPWKNKKTDRIFNWKENNDSICLKTIGENYQPIFIKNRKDTIHFNFNIESVMFKSTNGNILNGWFLTPKNVKPKITILHLHGNAGNLFSQYNAISPLVEKGMQVFMFDYSGFGYSEGNQNKENILIDANSALDYLKTREEIKNTKLVIYGQSIGGHLAVVLAKERETEIDALVIEGAFSSYNDIGNHYIPLLGGLIIEKSYKAKNIIGQFKKPVLIIHSNEDKVIPIKMGRKLYKKANEPKQFYEIDGNHINGVVKYSKEISEKIEKMVLNN